MARIRSTPSLPTEPIGSLPRPIELVEALSRKDSDDPSLVPLYEAAIRDTLARFEATGSPVVTDGEQRKYHNFWTYPVHGLRHAQRHSRGLLKQAVISPSALSLMYPPDGIPTYSREQFIRDLLNEHEIEVRRCILAGAAAVQIDFTEGRLAMKVDPSGHLLNSFIVLNNMALERFSPEDRRRIGVHTCPGGDRDSTHSAEIDYEQLLPSLFQLKAGRFYIALAGEPDRAGVLRTIQRHLKPDQMVFVGVVAPIDPRVETADEVRDRILEAARYIPLEQLGTTDDCGFAPFSDDTSTTRDTAFEKIRARVQGTALAAEALSRP